MGQVSNGKGRKEEPKKDKKRKLEELPEGDDNGNENDVDDNHEDGEEEEHEQDGLSVHSPCKPAPSSLQKEKSEVELELKLLEALEIYPPVKLRGVHRHFVLYGLTEYLKRSLNRHFSSDDVLKLMDRFYNLERLKPDDEETELLNREEDFSLPQSFFVKEDS